MSEMSRWLARQAPPEVQELAQLVGDQGLTWEDFERRVLGGIPWAVFEMRSGSVWMARRLLATYVEQYGRQSPVNVFTTTEEESPSESILSKVSRLVREARWEFQVVQELRMSSMTWLQVQDCLLVTRDYGDLTHRLFGVAVVLDESMEEGAVDIQRRKQRHGLLYSA